MKTDIQIASEAKMLPILELTQSLGIDREFVESYGNYKAKISLEYLKKNEAKKDGKLILVTAITPTPAGEGKTTTNVGLSMALNRIGKKAITALREPSLGPSFGMKGGAAGGGYAQVVPMEDINLHFTGDLHAITAANNLLAALIDNHLQWGNLLRIDSRRILWKRAIDMNDRSLRSVVVGLGSPADGVTREDGFNITVASEVMAILCLAESLEDLKVRLGRMIVAFDLDGNPVTCADLGATGAMALLLKDAIKPNLVQTLEQTPAIIHGGPFANIAHGCNSVLGTKMALKLADYVITEAGFGADLGAEKFFDIKMPSSGLRPDGAVLVATIRALKMHGGQAKEDLAKENVQALKKGFANLEKQMENIEVFGVPVMVAINRFPTDTAEEVNALASLVRAKGVPFAVSEVFEKGGEGGVEMAQELVKMLESKPSNYAPLYDAASTTIEEKMKTIATKIYGADDVFFDKSAKKMIGQIEKFGLSHLPLCVAKTQYSLSDNPAKLGRPENFNIEVRELRISAGAGFIVALTGEIMTMPGLPRRPAAQNMDILPNGEIVGLF